VLFSATVMNQGSAATPAGIKLGVLFYVDGAPVSWSDDDTQALGPGDSVLLTANGGPGPTEFWTATGLGSHTTDAWVDDVDRIPESNDTNNHRAGTVNVSAALTNGQCGSANGVAAASAPTSGLCSVGTASSVTGSGPWSWTCAGSNGGTTASCATTTTVFPIGVWLQHATDAATYKAIGVNTYIGLWMFPCTDSHYCELASDALPLLKSAGMKVYAGDDLNSVAWIQANSADFGSTIVGYMLGDEADMNKVSGDPVVAAASMPDAWQSRCDAIKAADPSRARYANFGKGFALNPWAGYHVDAGSTQAADFAKYVEPTTLLSSDYYGITDPYEPLSSHGIWTYGRAVDNTKISCANSRPVWGFVEASAPFPEVNSNQIRNRMLATDIMPAIWNMVVHGAQGFVYFCHDFSTTGNTGGALHEPGMPAAMQAVDASVQQYADVLLTGTTVSGVSASTGAAVGVTTLAKLFNGTTYIFAMAEGNSSNIYGQAVDAVITVAGGGNHTVTAVAYSSPPNMVAESRSLTMTGGSLPSEHFGAYQVRIYRY
jgi:hypothetical protein